MARWTAPAAWLALAGVLLCLHCPSSQTRGLTATPPPAGSPTGTAQQTVAPPPPETVAPPPPRPAATPPPATPPPSTPPPSGSSGTGNTGGKSGTSGVSVAEELEAVSTQWLHRVHAAACLLRLPLAQTRQTGAAACAR